MKALSVRQPWAALILEGKKRIELRRWKPEITGRILIHASKFIERDACERYGIDEAHLNTGAIVGSVEIVRVIQFTPATWEALAAEHLDWGHFDSRLFGWELSSPIRFDKPLPYRGELGLFEVPNIDIPLRTDLDKK